MKKQISKAVKPLVLAVLLSIVPACQTASVSDNKTNGNTAVVKPSENTNTNSSVTSNTDAPVSAENSDSKSETKSDEKLAQRIIGVWEGKNPQGSKIALEFKDDNLVYPISDGKTEKPAKYKVIDDETAELTTPDEKPETFKITVKGDKMTINADTAVIELTKAK